jgi:HEAT repeat protein
VVSRLRAGAAAVGLVDIWYDRLTSRRWWVRAEAARALGVVRERRALPQLIAALDDEHEEVRAAAAESLGVLADPAAIPELLRRLPDESRHQRARIIEALRRFGDAATPALLAHAEVRPSDKTVVADILRPLTR